MQGKIAGLDAPESRIISIPVKFAPYFLFLICLFCTNNDALLERYGGKHGADIDAVADMTGLGSAEKVAEIHASGDYRVFFLGFTGLVQLYHDVTPSTSSYAPLVDTILSFVVQNCLYDTAVVSLLSTPTRLRRISIPGRAS
jgi:hypothetical protein